MTLSRDLQEKFFYEIGSLAYKNGDMPDCEIAAAAGISPSYYCQMKNLDKAASLTAMISIAAVFGMEIEWGLKANDEA